MTSAITSEKDALLPKIMTALCSFPNDSLTDILRQPGHCTTRQQMQLLGS